MYARTTKVIANSYKRDHFSSLIRAINSQNTFTFCFLFLTVFFSFLIIESLSNFENNVESLHVQQNDKTNFFWSIHVRLVVVRDFEKV
jgi:hypothetical protein